MDQIFEAILGKTYTVFQFKHRLRILKSNFAQKFYGGAILIEPTAEDLKWLKLLPETFFQQFTPANLEETFSFLESKLKQTPTLALNLAFNPPDELITELGEYYRKNFNSFKLIDLKFDLKLIAGCSLVWNGVYKDYSLKARIEERKEVILQSFKKFLR
ncbi:hypothetical protein HYS92_01875 [Candidatus Daviesbacteria bacterium]|nr:hypothetical protein [Candidatus Daviesbacteria bacterium]